MQKKDFIRAKDSDLFIPDNHQDIEERVTELPKGMYTMYEIPMGILYTVAGYEKYNFSKNLIKFKSGVIDKIIKRTQHFFLPDTIQKYRDMKLHHQIGMLIYGPPGTGKTCCAQLVIQELVAQFDAVVLDISKVSPTFAITNVQKLRAIQSNPIVVFSDEVDATIAKGEAQWLTFLDGNCSVDKCIFLGCTNYLNRITPRITHRRSRIKYMFEVNTLPPEVYRDYIEHTLPVDDKELIGKIAYLAYEKTLTIDEVKHSLIDYYIDGIDIEKAMDNVKIYEKQKSWKVEEKDDD